METPQIAVINQSVHLQASDIAKAAAAVQRQVADDFAPIWKAGAVISFFPSLDQMPHGYWPIVVRDEIGINEPGVHLTEAGDKPFALILFTGKKWTITLSHEVLEMIVDPLGTCLLSGPSVRDDQADVHYLAEICDPCQSDECAYLVNGDQLVSDFVTPAFYNGLGPGKYSFSGKITEPRHILVNGYMTWQDPATNTWWQVFDDGDGPDFRNPSPEMLRPDIHLRGAVDRDAQQAMAKRRKGARKPRPSQYQKRLKQRMDGYAAAMKAQAVWWQRQIDRVSKPASRRKAR